MSDSITWWFPKRDFRNPVIGITFELVRGDESDVVFCGQDVCGLRDEGHVLRDADQVQDEDVQGMISEQVLRRIIVAKGAWTQQK